MEKRIIHATKRSLHALVRSKLEETAPEIEVRACKLCRFSSIAQRGLSGCRSYFLFWDSYSVYLTMWLGQGQLRISGHAIGSKDIVITLSMEELAERGMTKNT